MSTDKLSASKRRLVTYLLFAGFIGLALVLQNNLREMHFSKILLFLGMAVWAREKDVPAVLRGVLVGMVGLMCLLVLWNWFYYRNQVMVPLGKGVYRIENH